MTGEAPESTGLEKKKNGTKPVVVAHTFDPSTCVCSRRISNLRLAWLHSKFEASLGYIVRPDVKKKGRKEIQLM
jgi:hypothetical protein